MPQQSVFFWTAEDVGHKMWVEKISNSKGCSQRTGLACRAGIHCSSSPEPLLIKDIKVQVNKQKPNSVRPAQMKHNSDKMPNCSNVQPALQQTQCWLMCFFYFIRFFESSKKE
jgi:hypothetical protein